MKAQSSHRFILFKSGVFLALAALALLSAPSPHSSAQRPQTDRQLERQKQVGERRVALVIGNGAYQNANRLANPANDATDMAAVLRELGFELVGAGAHVNQTADQMKQLIVEFGEKLSAGGGVGLFYYAGHGVQSQGHNYLIPIEANILREKTLEFAAVDVNRVLAEMDAAGNGFNIVILDACRNSPFTRSWRDAGQGLAQVNAPEGTLIAYATSPGKVAADGSGRNGAYTSELLREMRAPGVPIEEMFKSVRAGVRAATKDGQTPWEASSLVGQFYFKPSASAGTTNLGLSNTPAKIDAVAVESEYWEAIRSSNDPQDYKDYLQNYPNGAYAGVARAKIRQLETAKITTPANSQPANTQPTNSGGNKTNESAGAANTSASRPKSFKSQQGIEMVYIPPGRFMMGSTNGLSDEKPMHEVTISQAFYIGRYEVTQGQWQAVMGKNPSKFKGCGSNCPVENVSWNDALHFINKLNQANNSYTYRLPTEAEWEYACRAGTTGDYYSQDVDVIGWYEGNSGTKTHAVGAKQPNAFGLYDMSGNVWEWCKDWYHPNYEGAPSDGSAWLDGGEQKYRVLRGGSGNSNASFLRSALRLYVTPDSSLVFFFGFRVVAVLRTQ